MKRQLVALAEGAEFQSIEGRGRVVQQRPDHTVVKMAAAAGPVSWSHRMVVEPLADELNPAAASMMNGNGSTMWNWRL